MENCPKCGSEYIVMRRDSRGIPEARCAKCDGFIKKMSTGEVIEYYENRPKVEEAEGSTEPCKFCTENYFLRRGRLGTVYTPIEADFCPMCGRKLLPTDRNYR